MMQKHTINKLLIAIIALGAALRLLYLGSIPSGFFRDEAAIAYNAFSIWKTGADEFGMVAPLVFRSFEVFFLPAYIYISAPIVGIFGLGEFTSRLLSALSGMLAIYLVYLIVKEIWGQKAGLFASFFMAIAPWHIFFSRGTFEGNLALTMFAGGFYFWIKFQKTKVLKFLLFSGTAFIFSMYSYQAERVVVPLFAALSILLNIKFFWTIRQKLIIPAIVFILLLTPLSLLTFKAGGYHRAAGVSIFFQEADPPGWETGINPGLLINNKFYLRFREVASLYFSYFSPKNLFVEGDANLQRSVTDSSVFYAFEILGLILGIAYCLKKMGIGESNLFIWLLVAPLPAALTGDPFHTYRSLLMFVPLTILIGYGFSKFAYKKLIIGLSFISLGLFIFNYAVVNQVDRAHDWDWGYKQIVEFTNTLPEDTRIVVDDPWTESYIHFLFFGKVAPTIYQKEVAKSGSPKNYYYSNPDEIRPVGFLNYEFRKVDWPNERGDSGTVFIMWAERLPDSEYTEDPRVQLLKVIYYPGESAAFKIVKIR